MNMLMWPFTLMDFLYVLVIALARTFSTMLNTKNENKHSVLILSIPVPNVRGKLFSLLSLNTLAVEFS